jgi:adenylate kinase family enzyme
MKILIIGGPGSGKSTYATNLSAKLGLPVYCSDPKSLARTVHSGVTYLPEGLDWSQGSDYIVDNWLTKDKACIIEGVAVVRALRKWKEMHSTMPCDKIVFITNKSPSFNRSKGQDSMEKAIKSIWDEISTDYKNITAYRQWYSYK